VKLINPEVRIENSSKCNANCLICARASMTRPKVVMSTDHFCALVDQAKDIGAKLISPFGFGEPFIDPEVVDKVQYCTFLGLDTFITTNAALMDSDLASRLLDAGLGHIRFSIHGLFARDYEEVHRGLKFIDVLRNVMNFIAINNKAGNTCKTSVTMIPMAGEKIEHLKAFWEPLVDWLEVWKPHNWLNSCDWRGSTSSKLRTCGRPERGPVQINADGKMMVCCFDSDAKMVVGDTHENTIEEILRGNNFNKIREIHKNGWVMDSALPCRECDQMNAQLNNQNYAALRYSNRDRDRTVRCTSSSKFKL